MSPVLKANLNRLLRKQVMMWSAGLVILIVLSIAFNYIYLQGQADQTGKFISQLIYGHEFRAVTHVLEAARLSHFSSIRYESPDDKISVTLPEVAELFPDRSIWQKIVAGHITVETNSANESISNATMTFEYNRFSFVPHAFGIWLLLICVSVPQTRSMRRRLVEEFNRDFEAKGASYKAALAKKVSHNIRTPLAALVRLGDIVQGFKQSEAESFQNTINQIRLVVSELDDSRRVGLIPEILPIYDCLRDSFSELRLVMPTEVTFECELEDSVTSAQVRFTYHELRAVLANLVTNSREALNAMGKIRLSVLDHGDSVVIRVEDNGRGIPSTVLARVTEKEFSFEKTKGSGLGLYLAKESIEAWAGRLKIESVVNKGTTVTLRLPIADREPWYVPRIKLLPSDSIVVVDDQVLIHELWKSKLDEVGFQGLRHFYCSGEDLAACNERENFNSSTTHVFMDQDLGVDHALGLEVLGDSIFKNTQRYLVTGNFDDLELRMACSRRNISLIPKTDLPMVPIVIV